MSESLLTKSYVHSNSPDMANLGFSTEHQKETWHLNRFTRFPERILTCKYGDIDNIPDDLFKKLQEDERINIDYIGKVPPKGHTIRRKSENIKIHGDIHAVIGNRTKQRLQFAETFKCNGKEDITFKWTDNGRGLRRCRIFIAGANEMTETYINGGVIITIGDDVKKLIQMDGFDDPRQFFQWFSEDGDYEIIHWTDKLYILDFIEAPEEEKSEFEKAIEESIERSKEEE